MARNRRMLIMARNRRMVTVARNRRIFFSLKYENALSHYDVFTATLFGAISYG